MTMVIVSKSEFELSLWEWYKRICRYKKDLGLHQQKVAEYSAVRKRKRSKMNVFWGQLFKYFCVN